MRASWLASSPATATTEPPVTSAVTIPSRHVAHGSPTGTRRRAGGPSISIRSAWVSVRSASTHAVAPGLGDGPQAFLLQPRPVNLQLHVPQHAQGEIHYWITNGVAGTGMPAWKDTLSDTQRWQIVRYLQALASGKVDR